MVGAVRAGQVQGALLQIAYQQRHVLPRAHRKGLNTADSKYAAER